MDFCSLTEANAMRYKERCSGINDITKWKKATVSTSLQTLKNQCKRIVILFPFLSL